jgi:hypothetical protein
MEQSREPGSNITAERELQWLKQSAPSVSTEAGMKTDERDEQ